MGLLRSERSGQTGRPSIRQVIVDLILRFAKENPIWGYDRIQGALANVGYHISDTTVGNVLKQHGIEPAPDRNRQTTWKTFIKSHWEVLAAIDFTTIEVWTKGGLVTYYLLFAMELSTRRVHLAACTRTLGDDFMKQIAKNLTERSRLPGPHRSAHSRLLQDSATLSPSEPKAIRRSSC